MREFLRDYTFRRPFLLFASRASPVKSYGSYAMFGLGGLGGLGVWGSGGSGGSGGLGGGSGWDLVLQQHKWCGFLLLDEYFMTIVFIIPGICAVRIYCQSAGVKSKNREQNL